MTVHEFRDPDEARRFLLQGLWLQRAVAPPPPPVSVKQALEWSQEIASSGEPMPPVGLVADLGHVAFGLDRDGRTLRDFSTVPGLPSGLGRTYEDHVYGKVVADWTFERAGDALKRYHGRDRVRGLAFLVRRFRERAGFDGAVVNPAAFRGLLEGSMEEALAKGKESLYNAGLMPELAQMYQSMVDSARRLGEVLGPEDFRALENGIALAEEGQQLAHNQIVRAAAELEKRLPQHKVKPLAGRQEVPTRVLDEDTYPVGGYTSISTKGSIESLLHSQLAFMEHKKHRPDLFD